MRMQLSDASEPQTLDLTCPHLSSLASLRLHCWYTCAHACLLASGSFCRTDWVSAIRMGYVGRRNISNMPYSIKQ
jgi:hypothetical protein